MTTSVVGLSVMPTHSNGDGRATAPNITDIGTQATPPLLLRRVIGAAISAVGILLLLLILFLYVFTPLAAGRDQHRLLSSLTGNPISTFALTKGVVPREGSAVALLRIPSLDLTQAVVAGSSAADLETGPGLVPGTVIPGEQGNSVIAGRRVTFGGPFAAIGTLHRGDLISITDGLGTFKYHVTTLRTALSGQRVVGGTKDNRLTLVTSNSRYSTSGLEVVNAILVGKPVPTLTRLSRVIPADQRGLSGDPGAGWQILIWALVFIGALVLTSLALRRWRRPLPTYLLAVPILIACGLFTVEAVALALPATL